MNEKLGISPPKRVKCGVYLENKLMTIREFKKKKFVFKDGKVLDKDGNEVKKIVIKPIIK